jgi:hypothetical protein
MDTDLKEVDEFFEELDDVLLNDQSPLIDSDSN